MKTTLLTLILFFGSLLCQAQMSQIQQMNQQMHQRMHMQAIQNSQRFMNNMMWQMSMNKPAKKVYDRYKFEIVTLSGDTITSNKKTGISFYSPVDSITLVDKDKKERVVYPKETKNIFIKQKWGTVVGTPYNNSSSWLFKTDSVNNVKFYAIFPEPGIEYITHYQIDNDTITSVTAESLKPLVADYPKAIGQLEKKKKNLYKALSIYVKEEKKKARRKD